MRREKMGRKQIPNALIDAETYFNGSETKS